METFSPEFAQYWMSGSGSGSDAASALRRDDEAPSASQQEALAALADRVSAARSVT